YVVYVVDNDDDCLASSGEARIHATSSTLAVNVVPSVTTICGSSTGVATVTVSGLNSTPYTYQLNGNAEVVENAASFTLAGLGAGRHFLRITDNCDEVTTEFFISNEGTNPFKVTAIAQNELLDCSGALTPGSITLTATSGAPVFEYRIDGGTWVSFATNGQTETINGLSSGIYLVEVRDANGCTYQVNHVTIERETSFDLDITSPVAVSPQTFCNNATVAHLQATGVDIKWYLTAEGGYPLAATTVLLHDSVYYAAQSVGFCQSQVRTAVKVYIDPNAVLDTPNIVTPQHFCNNASATPMLGCIATDGNTNIVWYASLTSDVELPLTTILEDNTTYYAALVAGDCQTSPRLAVQVFIDQTVPTAPVIVEHQYFCSGALIANIAVPNNQIVWYISTTDDTPLAETHQLEDGKTYYAAQKAGTCESARTPVTIHLGAPSAPNAPTPQFICGKQTLADINITGSGIVWYDAQTNGNQLPATTPLVAGETYWAAQSSGNCEGERIGITISDACYEIHGTVFPFVYWNNDVDTLFKVTARLYNVPTAGGDPVDAILASNPVHSVTATYYDGSTYIAGTPKDPGAMGSVNNPGKKISWEKLGKTVGTVDNTPVAPGEVPVKAVGMYTFKNVVPGTYILEISRQGFLTRWAKVTITQNGMTLGHREILAGEFNDDFAIRLNDISILNANFAETDAENYNAKFDVDGSLDVNAHDVDILLFNQGAFLNIYLETEEWINGN
ncbi:MAG: hypothetical protein FWD09_05365, partial [Lentimicrobiaceae bacterium]|nr:hypothetical protein [Lentimicrobiaceae bacterium]